MDVEKEAENLALWQDYAAAPTEEKRHHLIERFMPLVWYAQSRLAFTSSAILQSSDLSAYGYVGLIQAVDRFDHTRGLKFQTYAYLRVRGAIIDGIRQASPLRFRENQGPITIKSLDQMMGFSDDEAFDIPDESIEDPIERIYTQELLDEAARLVGNIPDPRLRRIMCMRYEQQMSFRQIGEVEGVTESRAHQLHARAIKMIQS